MAQSSWKNSALHCVVNVWLSQDENAQLYDDAIAVIPLRNFNFHEQRLNLSLKT